MDLVYVPPGKAMEGPQLVRVTASFKVAGIGEVEMRLLGHSTMSEIGRDERALMYEVHWTAWDPND